MTLLFPIPGSSIYLLDTCSLLDLDNKHPMQPGTEFSVTERAIIWEGLERLADSGRLKLIAQVKKELRRHHPDGLKRLIVFPGHRMIVRRTPALIAHYQTITSTYPQLVRGGRLKFDKADPWLITVAEMKGYEIVSNELRISERSPRQRKIQKIPDVCDARRLKCHKLRELAKLEGWLS